MVTIIFFIEWLAAAFNSEVEVVIDAYGNLIPLQLQGWDAQINGAQWL